MNNATIIYVDCYITSITLHRLIIRVSSALNEVSHSEKILKNLKKANILEE